MRHVIKTVAILLSAVTLTACGHAGSPTAARLAAPTASATARQLPAAMAAVPTSRVISNGSASIISNGAGSIIAPNTARVLPDLDALYADSNPPRTPAEEDAEDARLAAIAAEEPPAYNVDDRMPYGVVVVARSATTATIAWRTNVPTKGIIQFAKTRDFKGNAMLRITPKGFTDQVLDDVAKTDHKYTLTGLSRFTSYTFKVTAQTPLGLRFAEKERPFRTKFWALR